MRILWAYVITLMFLKLYPFLIYHFLPLTVTSLFPSLPFACHTSFFSPDSFPPSLPSPSSSLSLPSSQAESRDAKRGQRGPFQVPPLSWWQIWVTDDFFCHPSQVSLHYITNARPSLDIRATEESQAVTMTPDEDLVMLYSLL